VDHNLQCTNTYLAITEKEGYFLSPPSESTASTSNSPSIHPHYINPHRSKLRKEEKQCRRPPTSSPKLATRSSPSSLVSPQQLHVSTVRKRNLGILQKRRWILDLGMFIIISPIYFPKFLFFGGRGDWWWSRGKIGGRCLLLYFIYFIFIL